MAKTTGFGKREREVLSNNRLPHDLRVAITLFKNFLKSECDLRDSGDLTPYENRDGGLPDLGHGERYWEWQVGAAHPGDARPRGKRRLVVLTDAGMFPRAMFFTDSHYTLGRWMQLQYP